MTAGGTGDVAGRAGRHAACVARIHRVMPAPATVPFNDGDADAVHGLGQCHDTRMPVDVRLHLRRRERVDLRQVRQEQLLVRELVVDTGDPAAARAVEREEMHRVAVVAEPASRQPGGHLQQAALRRSDGVQRRGAGKEWVAPAQDDVVDVARGRDHPVAAMVRQPGTGMDVTRKGERQAQRRTTLDHCPARQGNRDGTRSRVRLVVSCRHASHACQGGAGTTNARPPCRSTGGATPLSPITMTAA